METSLKTEGHGIAAAAAEVILFDEPTAEAQVEELRSQTEERRSPSADSQDELASSRLRQAEEEVRRAEAARAAIAQAPEEPEAQRADAVDQTRILQLRLGDLSGSCQVHEVRLTVIFQKKIVIRCSKTFGLTSPLPRSVRQGNASLKDKEIASLSTDMDRSLASAEEYLRIIEVAAEDREKKVVCVALAAGNGGKVIWLSAWFTVTFFFFVCVGCLLALKRPFSTCSPGNARRGSRRRNRPASFGRGRGRLPQTRRRDHASAIHWT